MTGQILKPCMEMENDTLKDSYFFHYLLENIIGDNLHKFCCGTSETLLTFSTFGDKNYQYFNFYGNILLDLFISHF